MAIDGSRAAGRLGGGESQTSRHEIRVTMVETITSDYKNVGESNGKPLGF